MRVKIIGSGGCVSTPKPCCSCKICQEAREKGFPYARTGCCLYVEDANILIDTPEDVAYSLNNANIQKVDYILYSHCDPDHTMGMRVIEQLKLDWLALSVGKTIENPITVASLPTIIEGIRKQGTRLGSALGYYESRGLVCTKAINELQSAGLMINLIPVDEQENVAVFVIKSENKKIIYAPCDVKPFPDSKEFRDADYLIIGNTIVGDVLKDGFIMENENPLRKSLFSLDEVQKIKNLYGIKEVIITHLEEIWGKSYDDYIELEKSLDSIHFAYDGMTVEI